MMIGIIRIFGYGSLMSVESLHATVPNAQNIVPAYINGFRRDFSLWDAEGWTQTNLDVAGTGFCAVNITASDSDAAVNGVVFEMDQEYFETLAQREKDYELLKTTAYAFDSKEPLGDCFVFSSSKCNGTYDVGNKAQERYLNICLQSAKGYGNDFYMMFLETTYVGNKTLVSTFSVL